MPNVKYLLKKPKSQNDTLIYMYFRFNGKTFKYSIQDKINPNLWNFTDQRARNLKGQSDLMELNYKLDRYEQLVKGIYRNLQNDSENITPAMLKFEMDTLLGRKHKLRADTFYNFSEIYIDGLKKKKKAWRSVRATINHLLRYSKSLDFDDIDLDFYNNFVELLIGLGFSKNYIGRNIKNIKMIMNQATDYGVNNNLKFRSSRFRAMSENVYNI